MQNLLLVPSFAFPPSAIIKRKPLSPTARRAGWIGCNFALNRVPVEARIAVVTTILSPSPPSPTGERARGEVAQIKTPRPDPLPAQSRGEGMFERVVITPATEVRAKFKRVKPLKDISVAQRGWTLDVLNAIRRLGKAEFTTTDVYTFERELAELHPDNPVNNTVTRGRPPRPGQPRK
ncbi:MAG: DpnI domain-containing protein [Verrucomicrobiota bacterium]